MIAVARRNFSAAAERWATLRDAFPDQLQGYVRGIEALRETGQFDAAESLAEAAMSRFPNQPELAVEHANIPWTRRDWPEALRRWSLVGERFPDQLGIGGVGEALHQIKLDAIGEGAAIAPAIASEAQGYEVANRDLLISFEGLGDGCEFGVVQRHFGAEPLDLLRWAGIYPQYLIQALGNRFDGFGSPETTKLWITEPWPGYAGGEYMIRDLQRGFHMHSFVSIRDVEEEKFLRQTCRRMQFLREKLVSDLASGDKIFVYKRRDGILTKDEIAAIHAGVRACGPSTLLCVLLEDDTHPNGLVEQAGEGLLLGYIDRLTETANPAEISYESWLRLCRAARDLAPVRPGNES